MTRKFFKTGVYTLRKRFGTPADLYHIINTTDDAKTGRSSITRVKYHIKKAIIIPINLLRAVGIEGSYRTSDRSYPSQELDLESTIVLIDKTELPSGLQLSSNDYVISHTIVRRRSVTRRRFNIRNIETLEDDVFIMLITRFAQGSQLNEIYDLKINEKLILVETKTGNISLENFGTFPLKLPMKFFDD